MVHSKGRLDSNNKSHENSPFTPINGGFGDSGGVQLAMATWVSGNGYLMCESFNVRWRGGTTVKV